MKALDSKIINQVMKPKQSLRDLVLGSVRTPEALVLEAIKEDKEIQQVAASSNLDIFLLSLDLKNVFKINANFLYVLQEAEDFNFLMIPESEAEEVSHLINFITAFGVGSVIEVNNVLGMKRYTTEDIKNNISEVVSFSGYVKHIRYESVNNYPLPINNDYPFNTSVEYRGGYYVLELPAKAIKLSEHLSYYEEVYHKSLKPISLDSNGFYEYSRSDFEFISRLVLAYNFNCKRIAEVFNLPYKAFKGYLVTQFRYKEDHVGVYHFNDLIHDIELFRTYKNKNIFFNPYDVVNVA